MNISNHFLHRVWIFATLTLSSIQVPKTFAQTIVQFLAGLQLLQVFDPAFFLRDESFFLFMGRKEVFSRFGKASIQRGVKVMDVTVHKHFLLFQTGQQLIEELLRLLLVLLCEKTGPLVGKAILDFQRQGRFLRSGISWIQDMVPSDIGQGFLGIEGFFPGGDQAFLSASGKAEGQEPAALILYAGTDYACYLGQL